MKSAFYQNWQAAHAVIRYHELKAEKATDRRVKGRHIRKALKAYKLCPMPK
jgi:hypothetical protein